MLKYLDCHSHLADLRLDSPEDKLRVDLLARAKAKEIYFHQQGGVGPDDWQRQLALNARYPQIWPAFGLHPYWIAEHSDDECETALDELAKYQANCRLLGEMGLDLRPHIMKDSFARQMLAFESQLELASAVEKPVVLHLVQAFSEVQRVFLMFGAPAKKGFVHSFNGSVKEAEYYLEQGLMLSLGGPAARAGNQRLHQAIREIPLDSLLLETDCPDQPGDAYRGQLNPPQSLWQVAEAVAVIKGISAEQVMLVNSSNFSRLLGLTP